MGLFTGADVHNDDFWGKEVVVEGGMFYIPALLIADTLGDGSATVRAGRSDWRRHVLQSLSRTTQLVSLSFTPAGRLRQ